ncbi:transporter substrate-binding domain-containing protein [Pseudomonas sp. MMS21-TM103]|uniref:transporter substrate-binding domain-containing protein n=1 Tax=Pseudomonas sp. MMS21 TM103 TaxID=2886506 RepID=UPI001EDF2273|nr:transporter substrate-binding domain-containing protein [Pseudomonas sp. MMS21 TM103]MCG4454600.1 transporter substrate-binding domain-containing protein [Pseudomonas sp. MMS21 TM103]
MVSCWLAILLGVLGVLGCSGALADPAAPQEIRLASEVWVDHTNADGTGLAWDILRQVFEPAGIALLIQSVPYTRSIGLVQRGEADAWVGSYLNEVEKGVLYPHWHYDVDQISALGLSELPAPSLATLGKFRLVWMRGYEYQRYLPNLTHYRAVQRQSDILNMLKLDRTDFYIDARTEVDEVLETASDPARYRITDLTRLPVYLGFADTPRGQALAQIYDQRMAVLVEAHSLRPLFKRWQQPYPFD